MGADGANANVFSVVTDGAQIDRYLLPEASRKGIVLPTALLSYVALIPEANAAKADAEPVHTLAEAAARYDIPVGESTLGLAGCEIMQKVLLKIVDSGKELQHLGRGVGF